MNEATSVFQHNAEVYRFEKSELVSWFSSGGDEDEGGDTAWKKQPLPIANVKGKCKCRTKSLRCQMKMRICAAKLLCSVVAIESKCRAQLLCCQMKMRLCEVATLVIWNHSWYYDYREQQGVARLLFQSRTILARPLITCSRLLKQ